MDHRQLQLNPRGQRAGLSMAAVALLWASGCGPADGHADRSAGDAEAPPAVTAPDAHEYLFEEARELVTRDGSYRITWKPEGGTVPVNEHFSVLLTLTKNDDDRTPVTGAEVSMTCFMPEHGHGMLREPRSEELGDGQYKVNGFLLHMDGYWTVSVNVNDAGMAATADDELRL